MTAWPVDWDGVAETVVTTRGPNDRWNVAALGVHAGDPATARTWGRTRTWRNFTERGRGYVQFTRDPVDFVEAACSVREEDEQILDSASAWAEVRVEQTAAGEEDATQWVDWALHVESSEVRERSVPTVSRAHAAVVEATVAASRLGVPGYDDETLRERIAFFQSVVERAGGDRDREAWRRFETLTE